jgi:hypothetical protein
VFLHARTTLITTEQVGWWVNPRQATFPSMVTLLSWKEQSAAPA